MSKLILDLPAGVEPDEATLLLSIKLVETNRISAGKGAEMAGYTKREFITLLSKQGIPVVDYPAKELDRELED